MKWSVGVLDTEGDGVDLRRWRELESFYSTFLLFFPECERLVSMIQPSRCPRPQAPGCAGGTVVAPPSSCRTAWKGAGQACRAARATAWGEVVQQYLSKYVRITLGNSVLLE